MLLQLQQPNFCSCRNENRRSSFAVAEETWRCATLQYQSRRVVVAFADALDNRVQLLLVTLARVVDTLAAPFQELPQVLE